ncbi:MAG: hypothetical protein AB7I33_12945 [Gemmatimonadales bacterium]
MTDAATSPEAALAGHFELKVPLGPGPAGPRFLGRLSTSGKRGILELLETSPGPEALEAHVEACRGVGYADLPAPEVMALGRHRTALFYPGLAGDTLAAMLERSRHLPGKEALRITTAVARTLDRAHRAGLMHGDLTDRAVLLDGQRVLVTGFGFTALMSDGDPPESSVDQDTYRLAQLVYRMLAGERPPAPEPDHGGRRRKSAPPLSIRLHRPELPPRLDHALQRGLSPDPDDRYSSPIQLANALEESLRGGSEHEPHSDRSSQMMLANSFEFSTLQRHLEEQRRRRIVRLVAAVLLLVAAAAVAWTVLG